MDAQFLTGQLQETFDGDLPDPYARSAPLFIHDLLDHNLGPEWPEFMSLDTDDSPWAQTYDTYDLSEYLFAPGGRKRLPTKHTLLQTGSQNGRLDGSTLFNSSCCLHCCHHFRIYIIKPNGDQSPCKCPGKALSEGFHQLSFSSAYAETEVAAKSTERYRLISGARYKCTSDKCGTVVEVEVSQPRIAWEWIEKLTDKDRILRNLQNAVRDDPERFADAQESWVDVGLAQLFTYAKDLITKSEVKRLTKRNKRFVVVMGPEMYDLFRFIGFTDSTVESNGVTEECFVPTIAEPISAVTRPGTYRAFVEDIQTEVECLMRHVRMQKGDFSQLNNRLAIRSLEDSLDCDGYTFIEGGQKLSWPFRFLGAMPNFSTRLLEDTYQRHCTFDPNNKDCYTDALFSISRDLTNGHGEEFARKVRGMINIDMDYLLSTWDVPDPATDDEIILGFHNAIRDNPSQTDMSFELLQTFVNQGRRSARLQRLLQHNMPASLGWDILGLNLTDGTSTIIEKARSRVDIIKKETVARAVVAVARERQDVQILRAAKRIRLGAPPPLWPVGLENIGNTCYLNSILQYLYTLVPIQKLVNVYPSMELSESDVAERRIGASKSKVSLLDLLVSQEFVKELERLFVELRTVSIGPTQPTQVLANTVLLTDTQLRTVPGEEDHPMTTVTQPNNTAADPGLLDDVFMVDAPPPVTEPSAAPSGTVSLADVNPIAGGTVTPPAEVANTDITSNVSSETLVGEDDTVKLATEHIESAVTPPTATSITPPAEDVLDRGVVRRSLGSKHEFSMQQQDVEEIFGRIIDRIQAGIASTGSVYDDIQNDFVMQTFFFRMVTYTIKKDASGQELPAKRETPEFYRYITAFPAQSDSCTLYEALDRTFDRDEIEGVESMSRYTAILDNPPPILHILVQRTQDNGQKNYNPVIIEEFLDLDRYMDAPDGSDLMNRRKQGWAIRKRLRALDPVAYGNIKAPVPTIPSLVLRDEPMREAEADVNEALEPRCEYACEQDGLNKAVFQSIQDEHNAFVGHESRAAILDESTKSLADEDATLMHEFFEDEKLSLTARYNSLFSDMSKLRYRLHAVFCHSGRQSGGHYWVWIRDFKAGVWRKYNDTRIEQKADILSELNSGSDPYYLCYALDKEADSLVDVPMRAPREEESIGADEDFNALDDEA